MKEVFNWSELHFSEVTSYKIHTLDILILMYFSFNAQFEIQYHSMSIVPTTLVYSTFSIKTSSTLGAIQQHKVDPLPLPRVDKRGHFNPYPPFVHVDKR